MSRLEMATIERQRKMPKLWLCIVLASACTGGTLASPKPPAPRPIEDYRLSSTKGAVSVAVEPMFDEDASKRLFVMDLPSLGIVPVYVVVHNAGDRSILVQKSNIKLDVEGASADHSRRSVPPAGAGSRAVRYTGAAVMGIGALVSGPGAIVLGPAAILMLIPESNRHEANQRLMYCELPDKALAPGETVFGFIYLHLDTSTLKRGDATLHVRVASTSPQGERSEEFSFDIRGSGR